MIAIQENAGRAFNRYILESIFDIKKICSIESVKSEEGESEEAITTAASSIYRYKEYFKNYYISAINNMLEDKHDILNELLIDEVKNAFRIIRYNSQFRNQSLTQLLINYLGSVSYKRDANTRACFQYFEENEIDLSNEVKLDLFMFHLKPLLLIICSCGGQINSAKTIELFDIIVVRVLNRDIFEGNEISEIFNKFILPNILSSKRERSRGVRRSLTINNDTLLKLLPPHDKNYEVDRLRDIKECLYDPLMRRFGNKKYYQGRLRPAIAH